VRRYARQYIPEPGERLDRIPLARRDEAHQYGRRPAAGIAAKKRPVAAANGHHASISAHIGQEVEVHYRWHPLYGRRLRVQHSEQRVSGRVIHVEVEPGTVTILPDWMVDASVCAGMALGAPRISMDALRELRRLLSDPVIYLLQGFGGRIDSWINGRFQGLNLKDAMDRLIAAHDIGEMIVVMPDARNHYFGSHYVNSAVTGEWADAIARDLVAHVDRKYRTIASPDSRGLAGWSMGGRGALYLAMR
jgi:hypothetical protein